VSAHSVVCIGNFDGIHRGHQQLFALVNQAASSDSKKTLLTFEPHPRVFFAGQFGKLAAGASGEVGAFVPVTSFRQKYDVVSEAGFNYLFAARFNRELAERSPEEFVRSYLVEALCAKVVVVGYDWAFGRGRSGTPETLVALGKQAGFKVVIAEPVVTSTGAEKISSSAIRAALSAGDVKLAGDLLGRPYRLSGRVRRGEQRGRTIGFPTANQIFPRQLLPGNGVYATRVCYAGQNFAAVTNIGVRPTFGGGQQTVESHLIEGGPHELYGIPIEVTFIARIRDEQRFASVEALKEQIGKDVQTARAILFSAQ